MKKLLGKLFRCEFVSVDENDGLRKKQSSWRLLYKELKERTINPFRDFSFVAYFFIAVFAVSAAGVWLEIYNFFLVKPDLTSEPTAPLRTAIVTLIPALAGSATLQVIWTESSEKYLRAFAALVLFILTFVSLAIAPIKAVPAGVAFAIGGVASFIAMWIWWIANANNPDFRDEIDPDAAVGKKPLGEKLSGSLDEFKI
ncbi:MAG: hypothetical protein ACOH2K_16270 [Burkholderiaceae bacterium]